nr:hypothetical protein [Pandoravirus belohorizontensis]
MTDRGARKHEQRKKRTRERSHARSSDGGVRWRRRRTAPYLVWPDENRLRPRIRRGRASPFSAPFLPRTRVAFFFFFLSSFFPCVSPFLFIFLTRLREHAESDHKAASHSLTSAPSPRRSFLPFFPLFSLFF